MPEVGEGVTKGVVGKLLVKEGDRVAKDQLVIEVETDKALVEVPIDRSGTVEKVPVKSGDEVPIGATLLVIAEEADNADSKPADSAPPKQEATPQPAAAASSKKATYPASQPEAPNAPTYAAPANGAHAPATLPALKSRVELSSRAAENGEIAAGPATRRLARELNIDLAALQGSGPKGRITKEDVMAFAQSGGAAIATSMRPAAASVPPAISGLPDFSRYGPVQREPINMVRRRTAEHMALSWSIIPHVTQFEEADITDLEALRERHKERAKEQGGKLTLTVLALKAVITALRRYPQFNASFDADAGEIIYKQYYHIGIATETERGLLVPVIHDVDRKDIFELSVELADTAQRAREGKLALEEMQGGSFTLSNQGGIGGEHFTPIINYPEVAIMAIGRSRTKPRYINGELIPREICPIAVSYDHRVIDGAMAARFVDALKISLEDPEKLLLGL
jgi:pyruvate dehydrogenase E2 component (dihydrolipoamide acetyltransferase)